VNRDVCRRFPDEGNKTTLEQSLSTHGLPECRTLSSTFVPRATRGAVQNDAGGDTLPIGDETEESDVGIDVEHEGILADGMVFSTFLVEDSVQLGALERCLDEVVVYCLNCFA